MATTAADRGCRTVARQWRCTSECGTQALPHSRVAWDWACACRRDSDVHSSARRASNVDGDFDFDHAIRAGCRDRDVDHAGTCCDCDIDHVIGGTRGHRDIYHAGTCCYCDIDHVIGGARGHRDVDNARGSRRDNCNFHSAA